MNLSAARVFVRDLQSAHDFYGQALGLAFRAGGPDFGYCVYSAGNCQLVIEAVAAEAPQDEQALVGRFTGLSFSVSDVEAEFSRLSSKGVFFTGAPELQAWGGTLAMLRDPAGNELQLVQYPNAA
jgi:predicted enzyme related to lactoylglutathione lyase